MIVYAFPGLGKTTLAEKEKGWFDTDTLQQEGDDKLSPEERTAKIKPLIMKYMSEHPDANILTNIPDIRVRFDRVFLPSPSKLAKDTPYTTEGFKAFPIGEWVRGAREYLVEVVGQDVEYLESGTYLSDVLSLKEVQKELA